MVQQGAEVAAAGLGGDPVDRGAVDGGGGDVAGTKRVASDRDALKACTRSCASRGAFAHRACITDVALGR